MLAALDWALLTTSLDQLAALEGTPWQEAARRNAAYFAVAVKLSIRLADPGGAA
jgi:hypothetical protein